LLTLLPARVAAIVGRIGIKAVSLPEFSQPHQREVERARIQAIKAMSPARKLEIGTEMYWFARKLKAAGVRRLHPDWTEAQVEAEVRRIFLHART
jgi:hypothetical protein